MKLVNLKPSIYMDFNKESNKEGPKFKVGDNVRILKHKNILAKCYVPNQSEEVFVIKKVKKLCCGLMLLVTLMEKKLLQHFTEKNCKNQIKKSLEF